MYGDVPGDVPVHDMDGGVDRSCGVFFPGKLGEESHWRCLFCGGVKRWRFRTWVTSWGGMFLRVKKWTKV